MQIIKHEEAGLGRRITEILTERARVVVISNANGHNSEALTWLEQKQFIRQMMADGMRESEALFCISRTPTELIALFPKDVHLHMPRHLKTVYARRFKKDALERMLKKDGDTAVYDTLMYEVEQSRTILPYRKRSPQRDGQRMLFIRREIHVGDITVEACENPRSTELVEALSITADGQQTVVSNKLNPHE